MGSEVVVSVLFTQAIRICGAGGGGGAVREGSIRCGGDGVAEFLWQILGCFLCGGSQCTGWEREGAQLLDGSLCCSHPGCGSMNLFFGGRGLFPIFFN